MATPFRLYVCSDIHASERTWRKLLNATKANLYKADAVLIAGDLTGKALVAVVKGEEGGEAWTATVLGQRRVARDEAELAELERSIADLGYYAVRVTPEERAAELDPERRAEAVLYDHALGGLAELERDLVLRQCRRGHENGSRGHMR